MSLDFAGLPLAATLRLLRPVRRRDFRLMYRLMLDFQCDGVLALYLQLDLPDDPRYERNFCLPNKFDTTPGGAEVQAGEAGPEIAP